MNHFPSICKTLALTFSFTLGTAAATPASEEISLRFVFFPKTTEAVQLELLNGDEQTLSIETPTNHISKIHKVARRDQWNIGQSSTEENDAFSFQSLGKADVLDCKEQLIVILRDNPDEPDQLRLIVLDNLVDFTGGQYLITNLTDVAIGGIIGTRKFDIKPGKHGILEPIANETNPHTKRSYTDAMFSFSEQNRPFLKSTWRFSTKTRSIVLFHNDPNTDQIRLHTIRDYVE